VLSSQKTEMQYIIVSVVFILIFLSFKAVWRKKKWVLPDTVFPTSWRNELIENIAFYNSLNSEEKKLFEYEVQEFLLNCKITPIQTEINLTDRLMVASSAVIPIFAFPDWKYYNLQEVLVYEGNFDDSFQTESTENHIMGMVGTGSMEGKMILSKTALRKGFSNASDKNNTAIHEFIHLIDKMDGATDGIPELLFDKQFVIPWLDLIYKEIDNIWENKSDINPYGGTSPTEFLAVAGEYFFEKAPLMQEKHPELYKMMEMMFRQKMNKRKLQLKKFDVGRNALCPCGSGEKFKNCCGKGE